MNKIVSANLDRIEYSFLPVNNGGLFYMSSLGYVMPYKASIFARADE